MKFNFFPQKIPISLPVTRLTFVPNTVTVCGFLCRKLRKKVEYLCGDLTGRYDSTHWYYQPAEDRIPGHVRGKFEIDRAQDGQHYRL